LRDQKNNNNNKSTWKEKKIKTSFSPFKNISLIEKEQKNNQREKRKI
jgi:hypothetical protein